jgi:uncharacterized protein
MNIIVFGSTGRVGENVIQFALERGDQVTAFARNPTKVTAKHRNLTVVQGDIYQYTSVVQALQQRFDVVINVVGADTLKPSTVVQDCAKIMVEAMLETKHQRYLGISGTVQMPANTAFARFSQNMVRRFIPAALDHQVAYETIQASSLDYALAACPYISNGKHTQRYKVVTGLFPGGFKIISPQDVADFLVKEAKDSKYHRQAIGLWY